MVNESGDHNIADFTSAMDFEASQDKNDNAQPIARFSPRGKP
jgi:hypothetical protein